MGKYPIRSKLEEVLTELVLPVVDPGELEMSDVITTTAIITAAAASFIVAYIGFFWLIAAGTFTEYYCYGIRIDCLLYAILALVAISYDITSQVRLF
jgi:hypothetical protein